MSETLFIKDFSAGWCPSDDPINGRPNACISMKNLEINKNGALTLVGGTSSVQSGYSGNAHTLYPCYINGTRYDYAACSDGSVYRNNTSIASGGDTTNAGFGTAFNYTLIASGNQRYKDSGTALQNLGIVPPTVPSGSAFVPMVTDDIPLNMDTVIPTGYGSSSFSGSQLNLTTNNSGVGIIQTYPSFSEDFTVFSGAGISAHGTQTQDDYVTFLLNGFFLSTDGFQLDLLLVAPDSSGDQVSDFFSYNTGSGLGIVTPITTNYGGGITITNALLVKIRRSDFTRVGFNSTLGWSTIYGFRISFSTNRVAPATVGINVQSPTAHSNAVGFNGGSLVPNGIYDYALMGVNQATTYIGKSTLSPYLTSINTESLLVPFLSWAAPTDPQITNVWIFRRNAATGGGNGTLGQWYRVGNVPVATTTFYDTTSDQVALTIDITVNLNLISIASSSIADKIYDIVGPIEDRWFYFTTNFMYPSDINDPDLVDASEAVRICGSTSELFMWARAISASVVLVGTSLNVYLLTGTFTTLPDNSIDVYYQQEGITQFPPVTYDAVVYQGAVYYLAHDGWRVCTATSFGTTYSSAQNSLIVAPNLDSIYKGIYNAQAPGSVRFPVSIANNKLYAFFPLTNDIHVYDFTRQYWTHINYNLGAVSALATTQDGQLLAFFTGDKHLRSIGITSSKLIDGVTKNSIVLLLTYKDNGQPRQRKDPYTLQSKCFISTGDSLTVLMYDENGHYTILPNLVATTTTNGEQSIDMSQFYGENTPNPAIPKLFQPDIYGTVADFTLENLSIVYDARPVPSTFLRIYPNNLKQPSLKRIRTLPLTLDTLGNNVTFTPIIDSVAYPAQASTFNTIDKRTVYHYFTIDALGVDYGGLLYDPSGLMEFWEMGAPEIVEVFPVPKLFDQIGPQEFSRLGKIIQIGLRVYPYAGLTSIPFNILFQDSSVWTGSFTIVPLVDDTYYLDIPKGVNGRVLRVTLGPTSIPFCRYYMKFKCAPSGGPENTELNWITIPGQMPTL